jgi:glycosyltransferase involved in cell wall biosynthesis
LAEDRRIFAPSPRPRAGNQIAKLVAVTRARQTAIAVVMTSFDPGGTERQMIELARRLDRTRWRVHLACLHNRGTWHAKAAEAAPVAAFPISGFGRPDTYRQVLAFARWCSRHNIELVHTADLYTNIFALPAAALARVPVRIGSRRGANTDRTNGHLAMQRAAYRCAHAVVANSRAIATRLRVEGVSADKVTVIPNGLDLRAFSPAGTRDRRRHVLVVANLRPEKGYDVLIDAAALVLQRYPDAHFHCVGTGPELPALERRMAERGVMHAFTILGSRDDVPARLAAADIFVLPSRTESMPNSVLEAMAAGLPVVASAVGGVPEIIRDEHTGLLCVPGDAPALAERLCRLMADPDLANRLGDAARRETHACYSFDRMVDAFDSLYVRELSARGRARAEMAA